MIEKGTQVEGPDGQYYVLQRDLHLGDAITMQTFKAYGGAPEPKQGEAIAFWLHNWIINGGKHPTLEDVAIDP